MAHKDFEYIISVEPIPMFQHAGWKTKFESICKQAQEQEWYQ